MPLTEPERIKRWRMILGSDVDKDLCTINNSAELAMDRALQALYNRNADDQQGKRSAGLGGSAPNVNRWLGDIRQYFPKSSVQLMQKDALERLGLQQMLLEPEILENVEADVNLVASLISLNRVIPNKTKETARQVVRKVVQDLERRLANPLIQAVRGSLNKATRTNRPRANEIDWNRTIKKNLKNYLPEKKTIIAEQLVGYGRKRGSLRDIVLCIDQSGSMAPSVVYSSIFGAVLASIKAVKTYMVVFDTVVVDLTEKLEDPVELLFGTQLGGGTDINRAVAYCETLITKPSQTIMVLITDLCEGGNANELVKRIGHLTNSGVNVICLLALSDEGAPGYDHRLAGQLAAFDVPSFACTPDVFPELMALAIQKGDVHQWAAKKGIQVARGK